MQIVALPHPAMRQFMLKLITEYIQGGNMVPEELGLASDVFEAVMSARELAIEPSLGAATLAKSGPGGAALEWVDQCAQAAQDVSAP